MKLSIKNQPITVLFSLSILATLLVIASCGEKNDPSPQDVVKAKLSANNWALQSVTVDGVDQTTVYQGLTIKFTTTNYTTTNGGVVWPASGTWTFDSTDGKTIKRDDGLIITVEATDTMLKLTLTWATTTLGGRTGSVGGVHVFSFVKM